MFKPATKKQSKLRMALIGPSGSGKTYSALAVGVALGDKVAVIDTERGSASKYADTFQFDVLDLETFDPQLYINAIKDAAKAGYDVLIIDSLSHAWMGVGGILEKVDNAAKRSKSGNSYTAWKDVTPIQNALVDTILQAPVHIIATMRAKTEYVIETNEKGKSAPRKVGMAPVQRDGLEYEFDVIGDMDLDNNLVVTKTRCPALNNRVIGKPGADLAQTLREWLSDGEPAPAPPPTPPRNGKPDPLVEDAANLGGTVKRLPLTNRTQLKKDLARDNGQSVEQVHDYLEKCLTAKSKDNRLTNDMDDPEVKAKYPALKAKLDALLAAELNKQAADEADPKADQPA